VKRELDAAGRAADTALQEVLGDKRMSALRDLRRKIEKSADAPTVAPGGPTPHGP
jgi:hypothetical protein